MRKDGAGSGVPQREQTIAHAWWRSRWFYLLLQAALGLLLIPLFGAFVFPNLPYLIALLAVSSLLLVLIAPYLRLNSLSGAKAIALSEREEVVRKDLTGEKTLLVSVGEVLSSLVPDYLEAKWRIDPFEHRRDHTFVELTPEQGGPGRKIKLALSFVHGEPRVEGLFRYDEASRAWTLIFGTDPAARGRRMKRSAGIMPQDIPSLMAALWFIALFLLAISAPCRALMLMLHETWPQAPVGMAISYPMDHVFGMVLLPGHLDLLAGLCGTALGILRIYSVGSWQLRLAQQVKNIPTATARSAAVGLAEFRGTARGPKTILSFSSDDTAEATAGTIVPFMLEDESGTIRVDPQGAAFRSFWSLQFLQRLGGSVVLTKRVVQRTYGRKEVRELRNGDPVYVLGTVEMDREARSDAPDSERLVVRRSGRQVPVPFLYRLLRVGRAPEQFTYLDVFFLSDTPEKRAYDWIMADLGKTVFVSLIWLTLSSWLVYEAGRSVEAW